MKNKRIDEVGALGNIAGLAAGAKGAFNGASAGKGVLGKIGGAIQGAKEGSAKKKGDWAVRQWARKLKVDFLRNSGATGDTPEAFKSFIDNAYKINLSLPTGTSPAASPAFSAAPASAPPATPSHALGGTTPASYGGGQYTNQAANATATPAGPPNKTQATLTQPYPQSYTPPPAGYQPAPWAAPVAPTPAATTPASAPPAPAATASTDDAISALRNLGYNAKIASAAVTGAATDPSMTTNQIISAALKSMAPPQTSESAISPRLGLYGEKSFTQLLSEGAVVLTEAALDDWCRAAAQQLLTKYPWLLDASVKYKVGSAAFATYLQKIHNDYGYDFGGDRAPAARSTQPAQRATSGSQPRQAQVTTSTQKIAAGLQNCRLPARLAPKVEAILRQSAKSGGNIASLLKEFNNIGITDEKAIMKLISSLSL